jgi:hypothetical protein
MTATASLTFPAIGFYRAQHPTGCHRCDEIIPADSDAARINSHTTSMPWGAGTILCLPCADRLTAKYAH